MGPFPPSPRALVTCPKRGSIQEPQHSEQRGAVTASIKQPEVLPPAAPAPKIRKPKTPLPLTLLLPELEPEPSVGQGTGPRRTLSLLVVLWQQVRRQNPQESGWECGNALPWCGHGGCWHRAGARDRPRLLKGAERHQGASPLDLLHLWLLERGSRTEEPGIF